LSSNFAHTDKVVLFWFDISVELNTWWSSDGKKTFGRWSIVRKKTHKWFLLCPPPPTLNPIILGLQDGRWFANCCWWVLRKKNLGRICIFEGSNCQLLVNIHYSIKILPDDVTFKPWIFFPNREWQLKYFLYIYICRQKSVWKAFG